MSTQTKGIHSDTFTIGWIVLTFISVLFTLWLIILMFTIEDEAPLFIFIGWAAFSSLTSLILFIPFRRGEKWAWCATWIQVIGLASTIFFDAPEITTIYLIAGGVMALCLLLTSPAFFRKKG